MVQEYRGKPLNGNDWVYGQLITGKEWGNYFIVSERSLERFDIIPVWGFQDDDITIVDPDTVGRYIGLNDITNNKIYEYDIIKDHINDTIEIVKFKDGIFGSETLDGKMFGGFFPEHVEVIGNIYDNPEIIKKNET